MIKETIGSRQSPYVDATQLTIERQTNDIHCFSLKELLGKLLECTIL